MSSLLSLSNKELLVRLAHSRATERKAVADVIAHLAEVDRRRLYLESACSSLYSFCVQRLGYSEQAALKRMRVARLVGEFPQLLGELESGRTHLTGLFLLSHHLTRDNVDALLLEVRGKTRREIERVLARWFPKPDVPTPIVPLRPSRHPFAGLDGIGDPPRAANGSVTADVTRAANGSVTADVTRAANGSVTADVTSASEVSAAEHPELRGAPGSAPVSGTPRQGEAKVAYPRACERPPRVRPLSAQSYRVEFTASAQLHAKLEYAHNLLSHAVAPAALGDLFERALDALIEVETKRRRGVVKGEPRKLRAQQPGSRHVPLQVARAVWARDGEQCTFVDALGRRCKEQRFLTLEHRATFARGGPCTVENLCVLCKAHNHHAARRVFGEEHVQRKQREAELYAKAAQALVAQGFQRKQANAALKNLREKGAAPELAELLRQAFALLCPVEQAPSAQGTKLSIHR